MPGSFVIMKRLHDPLSLSAVYSSIPSTTDVTKGLGGRRGRVVGDLANEKNRD